MRVSNQFIYWALAIGVCGSAGIWLPYMPYTERSLCESGPEILMSSATYFTAILSVSVLDILLRVPRQKKISDYSRHTLLIFAFALFSVIYVSITISSLENSGPGSAILVSIGVLISWAAWWYGNTDSEKTQPIDSLGGVPK